MINVNDKGVFMGSDSTSDSSSSGSSSSSESSISDESFESGKQEGQRSRFDLNRHHEISFQAKLQDNKWGSLV